MSQVENPKTASYRHFASTPAETNAVSCCCFSLDIVVYFGTSLLDQAGIKLINILLEVLTMKWETPSYTDLRFGFEVTMYIYNR